MARPISRRCWLLAASWLPRAAALRLSLPRTGRPSRSARSCRSRPAPAPTSCSGWCSMSCRTGSASRSSSRTAAARAARSAPPRPPRPIRTATRSSRSPPRTPSRRRSIRTCRYDVTRDFVAVVPFGRMPTALIISPSKGIKTVQELVAEAKAKPGDVHLRLGGRRIDDASDHGAIPAERGDYRRPCAVPRRRLPPGGGIGARRFRILADRAWRCPNVRDGRLLALAVSARDRASALPGRADHARGRLPELRLCALARHVRAGEDAARHRRPAARREPEGAAVAGPARPARWARCRADGR